MTDPHSQEFVIPPTYTGERLDKTLAKLLPAYSRSRLQAWLRDGSILVDGESPAPRAAVRGGEYVLAVLEDADQSPHVEAQSIPLSVVYEDDAILVLDKPAGLVMHPGAGNPDGTLQNALLYHDPDLAALPRAGIVHRLDKDTSGLVVVARTHAAHKYLVAALAGRQVKREYEAVACGVFTAGGQVDAPIGRHHVDRKRMTVRDDGRPAVTHYRVMTRFAGHTHTRLTLESGRTHQIRVHMRHIRHPLVGDPVYGGRLAIPAGADAGLADVLRGFRRQALHARRLGLEHPISGEHLEWQSPAPDDFQSLVAALQVDLERRNSDN